MLDIDAVTFDHFLTLVHPAEGEGKDIVYPILRALHREIPLDEDEFLRIYRKRDADYRRELRETCCECLLDDLVLRTLVDIGYDTGAMKERVHNAVDAGLATKEVLFYPDALETLEVLRERGYMLGLISNTHWRWLPKRKDEMESYFDVVVLSYEHGYVKPHPSIFQAALETLGVSAHRCLHVGDDPHADIEGAKTVGMKTVHIMRNNMTADADIQISRLSDLLEIL